MSKELTTVNMSALPVVGLGQNLDLLESLAKSSTFIERIQLYSKGKAVDKQQIPPGCFGVPVDKDTILNLGQEIDIIPLCVRSKAIDSKNKDAVIISYDETSEAFAKIKELSDVKDSKCMWGFAFLVYERSTSKFYEFFFGTKTARNEVPNVSGFLPRTPEQEKEMEKKLGKKPHPPGPCTIKVKYVTKGDWGWHAPVTFPCSTPFKNFSIEKAVEQIKKFMELKDSSIEKAEDTLGGRAH